MLRQLLQQLRTGFMVLLALTVLTGVIYPLFIMGVGQVAFTSHVNGSLISHNGVMVGSRLIGQDFTSPRYFWGRPSATSPYPYNASDSSASNLGPTNPALLSTVKARMIALEQSNPHGTAIPVDLVTASASGLDPEISPTAAYYQAARIAKARNLPLSTVDKLIQAHTQNRQLGFLGEPRVNVLELNLALDYLNE